jgi:hypothetical protein
MEAAMRRGKRIGLLLGTALLLASCATGSPYAYAPAYACEGCYGYPGFYANDFDGGYYRYYRHPFYHGTPDHGIGHGGFGGHGGGHR